jgi:cytochrome P450
LVLVASRPPVLDPAYIERPLEFRPERWHDTIPSRVHNPSAHFPFGSGPRVCPGRSLALLEMKLVLAILYKNFRLERVGTSADVREEYSFTMLPRGLKVRIHRRN